MQKKRWLARLTLLLSLAIGGGSLVLFCWFLISGTPLALDIAHSEGARLAWDAALCLIFFAQHSGMIRRGVKEGLARWLPPHYYPAVYSIASGLALSALVLCWQPTDRWLFRPRGPAVWIAAVLWALAVAGFIWGVRALRGFDAFGTLPLVAHWRGEAPAAPEFVVRGPYLRVRHPLYTCVLLLIWATPRWTTDRLLFNALWTAWIVVGAKLEERDLVAEFGEVYRSYQRSVPMLVPALRRSTPVARPEPADRGGAPPL